MPADTTWRIEHDERRGNVTITLRSNDPGVVAAAIASTNQRSSDFIRLASSDGHVIPSFAADPVDLDQSVIDTMEAVEVNLHAIARIADGEDEAELATRARDLAEHTVRLADQLIAIIRRNSGLGVLVLLPFLLPS